jgi:hypothetical protein
MNKFLLSPLLLAAMASTAYANSHTSTVLGFNLNNTTHDYYDSGEDSFVGFGFDAAVGVDLGSGTSLTFDLSTFSATGPEEDYEAFLRGAVAAVHINKDFGVASAGAFGGVLVSRNYYDTVADDVNSVFGLEAKTMLADAFIIDGEIAVINQLSGYYEMGTVVNTSISVQYFPQDNILLGASVGYLSGQLGDDSDEMADATLFSLEAAYQPAEMPVSFVTRISSLTDEEWWGADDDGVQSVYFGVRFATNGASLKNQSLQINRVADLSSVGMMRFDGGW